MRQQKEAPVVGDRLQFGTPKLIGHTNRGETGVLMPKAHAIQKATSNGPQFILIEHLGPIEFGGN